jgi:hypothetical protein
LAEMAKDPSFKQYIESVSAQWRQNLLYLTREKC